MTEQPLVTIGVAVYNGARWIHAALDSLLAQTYGNLEIVVCDNASTDDTGRVCTAYARKDPRVRYFRNERNVGVRGPNGNFWRVLSHASGEFFMWNAADDIRPPTMVEEGVRALQRNPGAVMVHGPVHVTFASRDGMVEVPNQMDLTSRSPAARIRTFTRLAEHNAMLFGLFRRHALVRLRFGSHFGHDYLLCLQACLLGPIEYISTPHIQYHQRSSTLGGVMYERREITVEDVLWYHGVRRYKCWLTLLVGCGYLLSRRGPSLSQRLAGAVAHVASFVPRYWRHLADETVFVLATPLWWLMTPFQGSAVRIKAITKRQGTRIW